MPSYRKLLAIDYVGTALTLSGCTLVILPLIWVIIYLRFNILITLITTQGGVTFPWSSATVLATLIAGCIIVSLFCIWEWKGAKLPIVPSKTPFIFSSHIATMY